MSSDADKGQEATMTNSQDEAPATPPTQPPEPNMAKFQAFIGGMAYPALLGIFCTNASYGVSRTLWLWIAPILFLIAEIQFAAVAREVIANPGYKPGTPHAGTKAKVFVGMFAVLSFVASIWFVVAYFILMRRMY